MSEFAANILSWYDRHQRTLPWRLSSTRRQAGARPDPYHVWLSEIMLQQTTVRAVVPYFETFIRKWPTVGDLAAASVDDVMRAWAGLGYYTRARNLKRCADTIATEHGGRFPEAMSALRTLPGIGDYTAAAIAAIAFDRRAAAVDGNVERVLARYDADGTPLPGLKKTIRDRLHALLPDARYGDFAQAMMDLGATICTPRNPACALCPLNETCEGRLSGDVTRFPVKTEKKPKPVRRGAAFVVTHNPSGAILLRKRPDKGLLGGMAEVPSTEWVESPAENVFASAPQGVEWREVGRVEHVFTHFRLLLDVYHGDSVDGALFDGEWWSAPDSVAAEALPTVMKKVVATARPDLFKPGKKRK